MLILIIHVVKPGESLYAIARLYGVSPAKIIADNELTDPNNLAVGQTLTILQGLQPHRILPGQSLYVLARIYDTTVDDILAANPSITNPNQLVPGQVINIPVRTRKLGTIDVNGYALPTIDLDVLRKWLPSLTYLSIFSYEVNPDGTLRTINDEPLIREARAANVAPFMVISNLEAGGGFSSDVGRAILSSDQVQDRLITNVINTMKAKNYFGLDVDFEYIYPADREKYMNFLRKVSARIKPLGYQLSVAVAPKPSAEKKGILYEAHDYPTIGAIADHVIIMTYEWGYTAGPAMAVAPLNEVKKILDYAVTAIPRKKILMGIPNYGYDWTLPFVPGTTARTLSNVGAVDLAKTVRAAIQYDPVSQAPFFRYYDANRKQHEVWFEDARSIAAKLRLVNQYGLGGVSYWTIARYFPQNSLVLNSLYNIRKVL